ncbi:MAG: prepilin-type N-terminal cleavage/methylation domain-containing protein [bacterium]|nr:prepilin-type N-terminal cleavage/methylation domain-containing protein [bacterium]
MKQKRLSKGFTLIEILVYIGVLVIVVLAVSSFFLWTIRSNAKSKAEIETLESARVAMGILTSEIREANSVYSPTSVFLSSGGQLSLETAKYLPAGETTSFIDFYLCAKRLCLKKEGQDPVALTSDRTEIESLEFFQVLTTSTAPSIKIDLKINYKTSSAGPGFKASASLSSTAALRSY